MSVLVEPMGSGAAASISIKLIASPGVNTGLQRGLMRSLMLLLRKDSMLRDVGFLPGMRWSILSHCPRIVEFFAQTSLPDRVHICAHADVDGNCQLLVFDMDSVNRYVCLCTDKFVIIDTMGDEELGEKDEEALAFLLVGAVPKKSRLILVMRGSPAAQPEAKLRLMQMHARIEAKAHRFWDAQFPDTPPEEFPAIHALERARPRICAECWGRSTQRCACMKARYCGVECQKKHRRQHRGLCHPSIPE
jgi:hypothetical protein